jgi:N-acetylmuramoyl-L-alanine amidase
VLSSKTYLHKELVFILSVLKRAVCLLAVTALMIAADAPSVFAKEISAPYYRVILNDKYIHPATQPTVSEGELLLPLRYVSETLGAKVSWDAADKTATVTRDGKSMSYGGDIENGTMMAPLSFFKEMFGAKTDFDSSTDLVIMNTDGNTISEKNALELLPSYKGYSHEDLEWLSKIVEAEATGETYASKLGVASVIINRRDSGKYPSTIKGVIFDDKFGVQFTPTMNGSVYNTPSASSYLAAMEALEGRNNAPDTLFFMNPELATSHWIQNNRQYAFTIGGHSYYY